MITHRDITTHIRYLFENDGTFVGNDHYQIHMIVSQINPDNDPDGITLTIALSRPGLLIGKKGETIDTLKESLSLHFNIRFFIKIVEFDPIYDKNNKIWDLKSEEMVSSTIPNNNVDISKVL
ncbi:conserved hypothetical protein [sediment metagenome]|uniref:KH type-2 domain-containing protein n=1 Tax=sediment metagenome TaxID=749907 RepID=D9PH82_9ZZZZ